MSRAACLALAGCLFWAAPGVSAAASGRVPSSKVKAKLFHKQAGRAYNLGNFEEALAGYSEAFRLDPNPAFLFNVAQCQRQLGNYEDAAFNYRRFLTLGKPRRKTRKLVLELIAEVERKEAERMARLEAEEEARRAKELEMAKFAAARAQAESRAASKAPSGEVAAPPSAEGPSSEGAWVPGKAAAAPEASAPEPVWRKWWVWTAVGVVVVGAGTATWFATRPQAPPTTLGSGSLR